MSRLKSAANTWRLTHISHPYKMLVNTIISERSFYIIKQVYSIKTFAVVVLYLKMSDKEILLIL